MGTARWKAESMSHDPLIGFMQFLTSGPDLDAVCNELVFSWPGQDLMDRAKIGRVAPDGRVELSACFASRAEEHGRSSAMSIWDDIPAAAAIRERAEVVVSDRAELDRRFPAFAAVSPEIASVLAVPLVSALTPHGTCVVSSQMPLRHREESVAVLRELSLALSLYVRPMVVRRDRPGARPSRRGGVRSGSQSVPVRLSGRQLAVLQALSEGFSNREIAERIGFSESTVRQETMAIYAFLGVKGRREAAVVARLRGMVNASDRNAMNGTSDGIQDMPFSSS